MPTQPLNPGRYAGGLLLITEPGALDKEMSDWLMGNVAGRRSLGRTAFGDLVIFRDLSARARVLDFPDADAACDIALVDVHLKRMKVLATSVDDFLASLDDPEWQEAFLRRDLYASARKRLGDYGDDECFYFVPALALGGSGSADSIACGDWRVHLSILLQL